LGKTSREEFREKKGKSEGIFLGGGDREGVMGGEGDWGLITSFLK